MPAFLRRAADRKTLWISAGPDRASLPKDLLLERDHLVGSLSGQSTLARAGIRTRAYRRQFNEAPPVRDGRRGSAARRGHDRRHVINATDGEPAESAALAVMCEHTIDHERMNVDIQIQLALRRRGFARCRA